MTENWYQDDVNEVLEELSTDEKGLTADEAKELLSSNGPNQLPDQKQTHPVIRFLKHFNDILIYILFVAAIITFFLNHYLDTALILLVAIINAVIGYIQENKAEKALEGIKSMMSATALVRRDDEVVEIDAEDVVVGDIISLRTGDKVPADVRIISASNLRVEESALTGEADSIDKNADTLDGDTILAERYNMAHSSSTITAGSGQGVVVATGADTEIGKINTSMSETETLKTPLIRQTEQFGKTISIVIVAIALISLGYGYFIQGYEFGEILLASISLSVAAIPEGLPAIISIILAIGVQNMANKNAIVKSLPSVETSGAVSVICSDKTGTLTQNEMTVTTLNLTDGDYEVTGKGYEPDGEIKGEESDILVEFLTAVKYVNESSIVEEDGEWRVVGEPTEGCLITLSEKYDGDIPNVEIIDKIPFDSEYKYMAYLVEIDNKKRIYMKGAPDRLLDMADVDRDDWDSLISDIAKGGMRLIAAGFKEVEDSQTEIGHEDVEDGIEFLGVAGIIDPPRPAAITAVKDCHDAGINVKMITGDHRDTAVAIAEEIGIGDGETVLEGKEIDEMTDEELSEVLLDVDVFARTSPENKLRLVTLLQEKDKVVAMTGDGVNDAPALKRADIGVAMGIKGTEVTKEASQMILVDDNFDTIFSAVKEGRRVYDNIKKTILYIIPTNGAEALLILAAIMLGITIPLSPVQILWVNMVTSITLSFALAFEGLERSTMLKPPRPTNTRLLSGYYTFRIVFVSLLVGGGSLAIFMYMIENGYSETIATTITLNNIVFAQIFHLFNCRSELSFAFNKDFFKNKMLFLLVGITVLLQLAITYVPFMNELLVTESLEAVYWLIPIGLGVIVFIVVEIEKAITRKIVED